LSIDIRKGNILEDVTFELLERDNSGNISSKVYKGSWFLCDNGYLKWSCLVSPFKNNECIKFKDLWWSQSLESMRTDIECTFGIMKWRFRILKTGIRLHGI
jgi:Plant transposon protein